MRRGGKLLRPRSVIPTGRGIPPDVKEAMLDIEAIMRIEKAKKQGLSPDPADVARVKGLYELQSTKNQKEGA